MYSFSKPTRDLKSELLSGPHELSSEDRTLVYQLNDLLTQILQIDPTRRITVEEALRHPFLKG
jgi:hypothetical protein